jgi:hypothetical protein
MCITYILENTTLYFYYTTIIDTTTTTTTNTYTCNYRQHSPRPEISLF